MSLYDTLRTLDDFVRPGMLIRDKNMNNCYRRENKGLLFLGRSNSLGRPVFFDLAETTEKSGVKVGESVPLMEDIDLVFDFGYQEAESVYRHWSRFRGYSRDSRHRRELRMQLAGNRMDKYCGWVDELAQARDANGVTPVITQGQENPFVFEVELDGGSISKGILIPTAVGAYVVKYEDTQGTLCFYKQAVLVKRPKNSLELNLRFML